jgi:hypothetical protein
MRCVNGDTSRRRRTADPARLRWYAAHRARRWAVRFFGGPTPPAGGSPTALPAAPANGDTPTGGTIDER